MSADDIPTLVKHMALAIYESGYGDGGKEKRIWHSLDAARWRLVEYGFLRHGSQYGEVANITLTAKGRKRDQEHKREGDFGTKEKKFRKLYDLIDTEADNPPTDREEDDNAVKAPAKDDDRQETYREKVRARRADAAAATPRPQARASNKIKKVRTRRVRRRF